MNLSLRNLFNKVFDSILNALHINIAGQDVTLLEKKTGVSDPVAILKSGATIAGDAGATALDWLDLSDYKECWYLIEASVANGGTFDIGVEVSPDQSSVNDCPFSANGGVYKISHTFVDGDGNLVIIAPKSDSYQRMVITPDGTNDITITVKVVRRV